MRPSVVGHLDHSTNNTANRWNGNMKMAGVFETSPAPLWRRRWQNLTLCGRRTGGFVGSNPWNWTLRWHPEIWMHPFNLAQLGPISFGVLKNWIYFQITRWLRTYRRAPERLARDSEIWHGAEQARRWYECCSRAKNCVNIITIRHSSHYTPSLMTKFHK